MKQRILDGFSDESIFEASSLLRNGEIVAFPTETVYGLGADAFNAYAVSKIFEVKGRPRFDPLIVHIADVEWLNEIVEDVPEKARILMDRFWPGPLTLILKKKPSIPDIVTAGLDTVAVRIPSHPVALKLLSTFSGPIAAPSANPFGHLSPTRAEHVAKTLKDKVPLILDGGSCEYGLESTILSFLGEKVYIHRHGSVSLEEIEGIIGKVENWKGKTFPAPGGFPSHYAPKRPLVIIESKEEIKNRDSAFLAFKRPEGPVDSKYVRVLSEEGNMREAASHFFSYLFELDREDVEVIYAEKIPEYGLGRAMMERLRKAAKKYV